MHDKDLKATNARLKALIDIGLELASLGDIDKLLHTVCAAARDLFGATYVTLGILHRHDRTVHRFLSCGADASCEVRASNWIGTGEAVSGFLQSVVAERRPVRGENPGGDPVSLGLPVLHPDVHAFLAAPISSPSHVYGWICLVVNHGRTFTDEDEHLVMGLAGQVGRIYELDHEILERQHAESALREERDRAQRYLDTAAIMLLALDVEGRITLVNRHACSVLGWTAEELAGRSWIDTCLPASIRGAMRGRFDALMGGDLSPYENRVLTKSGDERLIEWRNTVMRDDAGRVTGTLSSGSDITERGKAVETLRAAEERMRFALQSANVGIWDMDYTTGALRWSEILEAHYGLKAGTFKGSFEAFVERIHADDRESLLHTIEKAMRSGDDFTFAHRARWTDGTVRWLSGAGRIFLGDHGTPVRGVGISLDVTEHHTLEAQYQQAQKMDAVGQLAGGVAHDFNNLLTVILGYCELLLADLDPDDARQADIAEIQKAGSRASGLTRQLLAFSRKQMVEPTLLDLGTVLTDMRVMLARLIREDVKLVLIESRNLPCMKADRGQIEQIVMNLALNAQDAMPRGGTLTVETASVYLDEEYAKSHQGVAPGSYIVLSATDTGTGMTPEVQARLFEPFFTTKEPGKGTGLGLSTVRSIVTRAGGSISVDSEIGRGTTFKAYFPQADATELASAPPLSVALYPGTETVLVVEDEEGLRELIRRLLRRQGNTVLVAADAEEALMVFDDNPSIDLVLTDVVMTGVSGPELTKQLLERRPEVKVIYMSGYTEESMLRHGVLNPGIAFLHKPFTSEALGRKIREAFERSPGEELAFGPRQG